MSVVFSFKGQKKDSIWKRLYQVVRRSVILFGLGLFLNSDDDSECVCVCVWVWVCVGVGEG